MRLLQSHFILMVLWSVGVSLYFAFLLKPTSRERIRFFAILLAIMIGGGLAVGWLMYPFPRPLS